jgi:hypothetical protein
MGTVHAISSAPSRRPAAPAPSPDDVAAATAAGQRLLTAVELGRRIGRSTRAIRRDVAAGMPRVAIGARGHRFIEPHVLAWYAARQEGAGAQHEGDAA